ncbi:hypothetical protein WN48_09041 [Eufriesea mexicana]|uniref:Uncharacterized protein n=1 Tax=Eufriesea mexicana TaxID=516756 RepID=A0A310SFL0_9HYME|nr:hypothetical protein WN48_09041 [Eufriesea mexicana]
MISLRLAIHCGVSENACLHITRHIGVDDGNGNLVTGMDHLAETTKLYLPKRALLSPSGRQGPSPKEVKRPSMSSSGVEKTPPSPLKGHPHRDPSREVTTATSSSIYNRESRGCARPLHMVWLRPPMTHLTART